MAEEYKRAGWYPDPAGAPGERWWNGVGWSETRRGAHAPSHITPSTHTTPPVYSAPAVTPPANYTTPPVTRPPVYSADNPAPQSPASASRLGTAVRSIDTRANRPAFVGFLLGIIALVTGFSVLGVVSLVLSIVGLQTANRLAAQGSSSTLRNMAWVGLGTSIAALVFGVIGLIGFIAAITFDAG